MVTCRAHRCLFLNSLHAAGARRLRVPTLRPPVSTDAILVLHAAALERPTRRSSPRLPRACSRWVRLTDLADPASADLFDHVKNDRHEPLRLSPTRASREPPTQKW